MTQLVERLLPTPEVQGFESSHQQTFILDIDLFTDNCIEKTKIKKMRQGMCHLKNVLFECCKMLELYFTAVDGS